MNYSFHIGFGLLAASMILSCAHLVETDELVLVASDDVPESISVEARDLVENSPLMIKTLSEAKVIFIVTEVIRQKNGEDDLSNLYNVIHYRYDDDTAIHSRVNLEEYAILDQQEFPHLPTNFTPGELAIAAEMALADDRVRRALGDEIDNIKVEALAIRTFSEDDPWFGRRVLRLLFKDTRGEKTSGRTSGIGNGYLHEPVVIVDLTGNVVTIEESGPMENIIELPIAEEEK
jgi:hypothetical protein